MPLDLHSDGMQRSGSSGDLELSQPPAVPVMERQRRWREGGSEPDPGRRRHVEAIKLVPRCLGN